MVQHKKSQKVKYLLQAWNIIELLSKSVLQKRYQRLVSQE
jgi:hypothetical protein